MLTVITSVLMSGIADKPNRKAGGRSGLPRSESSSSSRLPIPFEAAAELFFRDLQRLCGDRLLPNLDRIILAQRKAVPVLRHQQPPRIGVAVEHDTEQVRHLALEPVRCRPQLADGRDASVFGGQA